MRGGQMLYKTNDEKLVSPLFNLEFEESYALAEPFMTEFQKTMITKLKKGSGGKTTDFRQQEIFEECWSHMEEGLLNSIIRVSQKKFPRRTNVRRLRAIMDQVLMEASDQS